LDLQRIIDELERERDRLTRAIDLLKEGESSSVSRKTNAARRFHAEVVLAAWFLIIPTGQEKAPLSQWRQLGRYDSSAECEQWKVAIRREILDQIKSDTNTWQADPAYRTGNAVDKAYMNQILTEFDGHERIKNARCIASKDPRLRGK
jgi:hypothetical protein